MAYGGTPWRITRGTIVEISSDDCGICFASAVEAEFRWIPPSFDSKTWTGDIAPPWWSRVSKILFGTR